MDFPVNECQWSKVFNSEMLKNDYSCSDAIPPSILQKHYSSIFYVISYSGHAVHSRPVAPFF